MPYWLGDPEMNIRVETDWKINSPIFIHGFHHANFMNSGIILHYDKAKELRYSQLDSISNLADAQENYTILEFLLIPIEEQTQLTVNIENFPTETIRKHYEFYWRTTLFTIKKQSENETTSR